MAAGGGVGQNSGKHPRFSVPSDKINMLVSLAAKDAAELAPPFWKKSLLTW